jgi:hypothetical protein
MSSLYQAAVYCWSGNVEGKSTHEVNYRWDHCSSGMLRGLDWYLVSEVSEQLISTAFKDQAVNEMSLTSYNSTLRNIPQE